MIHTRELAFSVYRHYLEVYPQAKHYYGCVANYGLVQLAELYGADSEAEALCKTVLARFPEQIDHPHYNFQSYRVGGIAKARAVWRGISPDEDQIREYAEELMTCPHTRSGLVAHPNPNYVDRTWIDIATAATPFLLFAGLHFGNSIWVDDAVKQTLGMYDLFMDTRCGLLHQCVNFRGEGIISDDHWSRGNGWGIFPLSVLCEFLPEDHPELPRCREYLQKHCAALLPHQSENGFWRQEITVTQLHGVPSPEESSGTALILAAMATGIRLGILDETVYRSVLEKGLRGLCRFAISADDATHLSCPGCLHPMDGSMFGYLAHMVRKPAYPDEPHGAGPIIIALCEAYRSGITQL